MPVLMSIIIPVYDVAPHLDVVLDALLQFVPHLAGSTEVILVDDGSPHRHFQGLTESYPIRYAYMDPPSPAFRAGQARNLGASLAGGERLLFLDSDCRPDASSLRVHQELGAQPVVLAGGITVLDDPEHFTGLHGDRRYQLYNLKSQLIQGEPLTLTDYRPFWSGNLSVPRKQFVELGGFWEELMEYGSEDQELAWRMREAGCTLQLDLRYPVTHLGPQRSQRPASHRLEVLARSRAQPSLVRPGRYLPPV